MIFISMLSLCNRLYFCKKNVSINIADYLINVFAKPWGVFFLSLSISWSIATIQIDNSMFRIILIGGTSFFITSLFIYILGLRTNEREIIIKIVRSKMNILCKV